MSSAESPHHSPSPPAEQPSLASTASAPQLSLKRRKRHKSAAAALPASSATSPPPASKLASPAPNSSSSLSPAHPPGATRLTPPLRDVSASSPRSTPPPASAPTPHAKASCGGDEVQEEEERKESVTAAVPNRVSQRREAASQQRSAAPSPSAPRSSQAPHAGQPSPQPPLPPQASSAERGHSRVKTREVDGKAEVEAKRATARPPPSSSPMQPPSTVAPSTSSPCTSSSDSSPVSSVSRSPSTSSPTAPPAVRPVLPSPTSTVSPSPLPPATAAATPSAIWARLTSSWARKAQSAPPSSSAPQQSTESQPVVSSSSPSPAASSLSSASAVPVAAAQRASPDVSLSSAPAVQSPSPASSSPLPSSASPRREVEHQRLPANVQTKGQAAVPDGHQQGGHANSATSHGKKVVRRRVVPASSQQPPRLTSTPSSLASSAASAAPVSSISAVGRRRLRHAQLSQLHTAASHDEKAATSTAARHAQPEWRPQRILARGTDLHQLRSALPSTAAASKPEPPHSGEPGGGDSAYSSPTAHSPDLPQDATALSSLHDLSFRQQSTTDSSLTQRTLPASACAPGVAPRAASDSHIPPWPPRQSALREDDDWKSEGKSRTRSQPAAVVAYEDEEDSFEPHAERRTTAQYGHSSLLAVPRSTIRTDIWGQPLSPARSDDASFQSSPNPGASWEGHTPSPPLSSSLSSAFGSSALFSYAQPTPSFSLPSVVIHSAPFLSPLSSAVRLEDLQQSYDSLLSDGEDDDDGAEQWTVEAEESITAAWSSTTASSSAQSFRLSSPSLAWTRPTTIIDDVAKRQSVLSQHVAVASSSLSSAARPFVPQEERPASAALTATAPEL